ncbi:MAG: 16S rRNA (adenine(1518)-N(6)/adenine(1519)-N(6))-dimethyltransferase RsmA [Archaeoglobaceae archaeon]
MPRLGQHVLSDRRVIHRLCDYAEISQRDTVLEVGCGSGNITGFLLDRARKVIGMEIDDKYFQDLQEKFREEIENGKLVLLHGDALKLDFPPFNKFTSNIPYSVSSPLTFKLLQYNFEMAAVIYQKEFARRMVADPGSRDYSRLSVVIKSYCDPEFMESVPRGAFRPQPEVTSAIVRLAPRPQFKVKNREIFEEMVKFVFSRRRKMVGKSLSQWSKMRKIELKIPGDLSKKRPEEIEPEIYAQLADSV